MNSSPFLNNRSSYHESSGAFLQHKEQSSTVNKSQQRHSMYETAASSTHQSQSMQSINQSFSQSQQSTTFQQQNTIPAQHIKANQCNQLINHSASHSKALHSNNRTPFHLHKKPFPCNLWVAGLMRLLNLTRMILVVLGRIYRTRFGKETSNEGLKWQRQ